MPDVISLLFPSSPEAMTLCKRPLTAPLLPGVRLRTIVWKTAEGNAKCRMVNADAPDSKPFLNHGIVEWDPARESPPQAGPGGHPPLARRQSTRFEG